LIASFTGHRPPKLGGYSVPNPIYNFVRGELRRVLMELKPDETISGMALGLDQWAAEVCIELEIPFIAAIPFKGQENYWPEESRERYYKLLAAASRVHVVNHGGYASWKMQTRNQWMVDNSNVVIAVFDGTPGGTKNCYDYADRCGKQIIKIDPQDYKKPNSL
jgi:uncharacterized phage-like protein YoqJ